MIRKVPWREICNSVPKITLNFSNKILLSPVLLLETKNIKTLKNKFKNNRKKTSKTLIKCFQNKYFNLTKYKMTYKDKKPQYKIIKEEKYNF